MRRIANCGLVIALIALCWGAPRAQQSSGDDKAGHPPDMQMPKPAPEMDKLNFLIGDWNVQGEYLETPMTGKGGKETGWYKARLGPGGFSVIADFEDQSPLGEEIGHELLSWDPAAGAYTTATIGNSFPGVVLGKAHWDGDAFVTEGEFKMGDTVIHTRAIQSHITKNSVHIEESSQTGTEPYQLIWKADAIRK